MPVACSTAAVPSQKFCAQAQDFWQACPVAPKGYSKTGNHPGSRLQNSMEFIYKKDIFTIQVSGLLAAAPSGAAIRRYAELP